MFNRIDLKIQADGTQDPRASSLVCTASFVVVSKEHRIVQHALPLTLPLDELNCKVMDPDAYGRLLGSLLFVGEIESRLIGQLKGNDQSLILSLSLGSDARLARLRWEYLQFPIGDVWVYLALSPRVSYSLCPLSDEDADHHPRNVENL